MRALDVRARRHMWRVVGARVLLPCGVMEGRRERILRARLARHVRRVRGERGLTVEAAAERADMHPRHWQKLEAGDVNATLRTLARVAAALATDPGDLLAPNHRIGR